MIRQNGVARFLSSSLTLLVLSQAGAQLPFAPQAQPAMQPSPLAGYWQVVTPAPGGNPALTATTMNEIDATGRFRQTYYFGNQVAGFAEGYLTILADWGLTQVITNWSPQYCTTRGCVPLNPATQVSGRLVFLGPTMFVAVVQDPATGQAATSSWQRASSPIPVAAGPAAAPFPQAGYSGAGSGYPGYYGAGTYSTGMYGTGTTGSGANGGGYTGSSEAGSTGGYDYTSALIDALAGERSYTDEYGSSYYLPNLPDPNTSYYSPEGNPLTFDEYNWTWTETDSSGWETQLEPDGYGE